MPLRIALIGPMGAGKTTIAAEMERRYGLRVRSFATPLKSLAAVAYGQVEKDATYEVIRHGEAVKMTGRELLQRIGTEVIRDTLDEAFWVRVFDRQLVPGASYVVDDCRFTNEYDLLRRRGFAFVRLIGLGTEPGPASHTSERVQASFRCDVTVANGTDDGTPRAPHLVAAEVMRAVEEWRAAEAWDA